MRNLRFTFLIDHVERRLLREIASHLKRSQGDAIRILIYRAADELGVDGETREPVKTETVGENNG